MEGRNEATTRLQLVDRIVFECLGWDRHDCIAEERYEGKYSDYSLSAPHRTLIVEAKREGDYFQLPAGQIVRSPRISIRYFEKYNASAFAAVQQCIEYCTARGTSLGAVTNGHQVIAFLGSRLDGVPPLDGDALVFDSLESLRDNFQLAWDCLSKAGVQSQGLTRNLSQLVSPPPPEKLAKHIVGYPGFKNRNPHQANLQILADLIIEDVVRATRNEEQFLRECYSPSGALSQYALVSKSILEARYTALSDAQPSPSLTPATTKKGIDPDLLTQTLSRRPILLVGDVGVGKTMFIKRLVEVDAGDLLKNAVVLYIDFGTQPTLSRQIGSFVSDEIARQLREKYEIDIDERNFVRGIFRGELIRFERGIYGGLKDADPAAYAIREVEYLAQLTANREEQLKRAIEHIERGRKQQVVIVLDNVDQRPDDFQQEVFLIGTSIAAQWPSTVFISLRPETFHRSRESGALSGYHARAFTISPPRLDDVIQRRLRYAIRVAESGELGSLSGIRIDVPSVAEYMRGVADSFQRSQDLIEFCDNMCGGNIRLALDFIRMFIGSGHVDSEKILEIKRRTGRYQIPPHEFLRAVIFGDNEHYDPSTSPIVNIFDITTPDAREHFLTCLLLAQTDLLGQSQADGYVRLGDLYRFAQDIGFLPSQIYSTITKALATKLLERPSRSGNGFSTERRQLELTHCRITTIGAYYMKRLARNFNYIDAIVVDTPIIDSGARARIEDVKGIADRLDRAELFADYLDQSWGLLRLAAKPFDWQRNSRALRRQLDDIRLAAGTSFRLPN